MKVAIIDDWSSDRKELSLMISDCLTEYGLFISHLDTFESGDAFLSGFEKGTYSLIFLDIFMEGINGIETARQIREKDLDVKLIFITSSNDYASESYSVRADYYLLKPCSHSDLMKAIGKLKLYESEKARILSLPDGQRIRPASISYTAYSGHYVMIYLVSKEQLRVRCTQRAWEQQLLTIPGFVRCTKGMIVNLDEVERLESTLFVMKGGAHVPISRRNYSDVKQLYSDFLITKVRKGGNR